MMSQWSPDDFLNLLDADKQEQLIDFLEVDIEFWISSLSDPDNIKEVNKGACLSFSLITKDDFNFFHNAATNELVNTKWLTEDHG